MIPPCTAHRLMLTGAQARHYQYTDRVEAMHHAQTPELLMLAYDGNPPPGATRADGWRRLTGATTAPQISRGETLRRLCDVVNPRGIRVDNWPVRVRAEVDKWT